MSSCEEAIKGGALELLVTVLRDVLISEREFRKAWLLTTSENREFRKAWLLTTSKNTEGCAYSEHEPCKAWLLTTRNYR
jgi:hypothetical protein